MASTEDIAPPYNDVASPGKTLFKKYEFGKLLGCGGFAKVYHARDLTTNQSVAIKIIEKNRLSENIQRMCNIKREISIMRRLNHQNILKLHEVLATKTKIYFVLEFAKNGEIFARVAKSRLSEDLSRRYFQQLISAVGYCHGEGVYHRDLKPENLLLDENNDLKVSDFGLSALKTEQVRDDGRLHTLCGTPAYVAPEVLSRKGYDGAKVDVWSCGVVLFVLVAGYLPFNDPNLMNLYRKIYKGEYRCPKSISSELKRFLSRVLDTNPETRITVDEIKKDPWFLHGFDQEVNGFGFNNDQYEKKIMHGGGGKEMIMNAFDIVTLFSKGLDLKGLFLEGSTSDKAVVVVERVVADGSPETVMERVAAENGDGAVSMVTKYWECGVVVLGQNGDVAGEVEVYRLTDTLSVVEAKRIVGKELGDLFCEWWRGVRAVVLGQKVACR